MMQFSVDESDVGVRLDRFLAERVEGITRSRIQRHILSGAVTVDGHPTKPSQVLRRGQRIRYEPPPPAPSDVVAQDIDLVVVHEDEDLLVVDKAAGLVVHPSVGHESGTLVNALLHHIPNLAGVGDVQRPGIVHRLDKDTSGLLVVCKTDRAHGVLSEQFREHSIERRYLALVLGNLGADEGLFDTSHARHPRHRKRFTGRVEATRRAITHYRVLERLQGACLVEARLETGRTHQVRVHFSEAGHPLIGDSMYGRTPSGKVPRLAAKNLGRQALHAAVLGFVHPVTGRRLLFFSNPPRDMLDALRTLGGRWPLDDWTSSVLAGWAGIQPVWSPGPDEQDPGEDPADSR
ncbi:MAG: RluA family pseudouridine synthase [Deltaproteobacteria bacterium]|nr:RluA family pseudouridine synthase [Deltaproteobacteria bacterium]